MEIETFDNIGSLNLSGDNTIINISHEYVLGQTEDDDNNIYREINLKNKTKVISSIPYLWFVLILTIFLFIVTLIIYLIVISTYNENYTIENNIYLKPKISGHNYSSILFDNGMKIILTQVHFNDTSGGAISFDSGYLDNKYKPGYLHLALLCLINKLKFGKSEINYKLKNYLGEIYYSIDNDYSSFYFTILNNGFRDYLRYFSELTYLKENDERINSNFINSTLNNLMNNQINKNKREDYLLEFLIYGYKDKNGKDILPEGNKDELKVNLSDNFTIIAEIMKELFDVPSKIKIILYSHYKMAFMRKFILKYFNIVFKKANTHEIINIGYNISDFETNKIIYYEIDNNENNYIKINYYIHNVSNTNFNLNVLTIDSGYFNYIKYILQKTSEGSLYYELTHKYQNISIKSINCNIDIILKSKILFSINIELNALSYNYLKEIINSVYGYMEKIKNYVNSLNEEDERAKELYYILAQNFSFTEDIHQEEYYKKKSRDLFSKDNYEYFLKETWLPNDFTKNLYKIKEYYNQLTIKNSVVILGINEYTKKTYNISKSISFIFDNIKKIDVINFQIKYSCKYLSLLKLELNIKKDEVIRFNKSDFISNYTNESELVKYPEDDYLFFEAKTQEICSVNKDTYKFFYFRDTSFGIPKLYSSIFILHPFLRPNLTNPSENDNLFFQFILLLSYLQSEINDKLSDAIRTGNNFKLDFNENYAYIDIYCYSDLAYKIFDIVKNIILNSTSVISDKYEIIREYAIDMINKKGNNINNKLKIEFYKYISNDLPIYNIFNFSVEEFKNKTLEKIEPSLNSFIFIGYLYGYYTKEESLKICDLFNINQTDNTFLFALERANLHNKIAELNERNFVERLMDRKDIIYSQVDTNFTKSLNNKIYFYKKFSKYNYKSYVYIYALREIFKNYNNKITLENINQKHIYLKIIYDKDMDYSRSITKYIIDELDKTDISKEVDIIGNRFYYVLKSIENYVAERHDDLKSSSITKSFENLYDRYYDPDKNIYFDIEFDEFKEIIEKLNNEFPNYIKFE